MGLIGNLKNNQKDAMTAKDNLEKEWKTREIPEELAFQIAENIYNRVLANAKSRTEIKSTVSFDTGILGIKKNFRYEIGLEYLAISMEINTERKDLWLDREWKDVFPENNGFFGCMEHDSSPTEILCGNINNLKKVFSIVVDKFKREKVDAVFRIDDTHPGRPVLVFYIIIPCDKNGSIVD